MSRYIETKEKSRRLGNRLKSHSEALVFSALFKVASSFTWQKSGPKWQKDINASTYFY